MKILFFCPRWGQENLSWNDFLLQVKQGGYHGVESGLPEDESEIALLTAGLKQHDLLFIGQHWQTIDHVFSNHLLQYRQRLQQLAATRPMFINSQTGKDYFSFAQNQQLIA